MLAKDGKEHGEGKKENESTGSLETSKTHCKKN